MRSRTSIVALAWLFALAPACADIGSGGAAPASATGGGTATGTGGSAVAGSGAGGGAVAGAAGKGGSGGGPVGGATAAGKGGGSGGKSAQAGASGQAGAGQSGASGAAGAGGDPGRDFSPDRTKFFGASRCASSGLDLCEDFESGTLDTKLWSIRGKTPVIDGGQKARGGKALHIHVKSDLTMGNGYVASGISESKTFPATSNRYYGRMFVYFQSLPVPQGMFTFSHWTFAGGSGTGVTGEMRLSGFLQNGKNRFGVGTDSGNDPMGTGDWTTLDDDPKGNAKAVPTGDWQCIEWMNDGEHNETRFWWDAVEHPSMHTTSTVHGGNAGVPYVLPQFTKAWVGFEVYQGGGEDYEAWIDEVAIDKERIGCVY